MSDIEMFRSMLAKLDEAERQALGNWLHPPRRRMFYGLLTDGERGQYEGMLSKSRGRFSPLRGAVVNISIPGLPGVIPYDLFRFHQLGRLTTAEKAMVLGGQAVTVTNRMGVTLRGVLGDGVVPAGPDLVQELYSRPQIRAVPWVIRRVRLPDAAVQQVLLRRYPWLAGAEVRCAQVGLQALIESYWPVRYTLGSFVSAYLSLGAKVVAGCPRVMMRELSGFIFEARPAPSRLEILLGQSLPDEIRHSLMHDCEALGEPPVGGRP